MATVRAVSGAGAARNLDTTTLLDCADPAALTAFWSAALGYVSDPDGDPDVLVDPAGVGPRLRFQQTRSSTNGERPRLELAVTGGGPLVRPRALVEAEVARLVALGGRVVGRDAADRDAVVLTDPEGNELCVR